MQMKKTVEIDKFIDDSYLETVITTLDTPSPSTESDADETGGDTTEVISKSQTIKGYKTTYYINGDNEVMWKATVKGTFIYSDNSVKCTNISIHTKSYSPAWKVKKLEAGKESDTASFKFTAEQSAPNMLNIAVTKTIMLQCNTKGRLS